MISRFHRLLGIPLLFQLAWLASAAQEPLTLRQAIEQALAQSPEAAVAHAGNEETKSAAMMARIQLLPQLNFTEDISRGDDPVYAFGTRLRQRQFTQADFALSALNRPQPIGNLSTRFSGSWTAFDSFKTQREIHRADLLKSSSASSAKAVDQQIVLHVIKAYQSVLFTQRQIEVAQHEQQTAAALLESAEDHVKAGLAVESDRMSAQVNAAARQEELIAAKGDLELAWAELREAMGTPELQASTLKPIEAHAFPQKSLEEELATATKMRPDLTALGDAQGRRHRRSARRGRSSDHA
jgi:outer membrane protein